MRVLLRRLLWDGQRRYRPDRNGTEVPDNATLPRDAKVWNGERFVLQEEYDPKRAEKAAKAEDKRVEAQAKEKAQREGQTSLDL